MPGTVVVVGVMAPTAMATMRAGHSSLAPIRRLLPDGHCSRQTTPRPLVRTHASLPRPRDITYPHTRPCVQARMVERPREKRSAPSFFDGPMRRATGRSAATRGPLAALPPPPPPQAPTRQHVQQDQTMVLWEHLRG